MFDVKKNLIKTVYFLDKSPRYTKTKAFFFNLMENSHSQLRAYFDGYMIGLVTLSVFLIIYESKGQFGKMGQLSFSGNFFEQSVVFIFIIEYLLRGWLHSDSRKTILAYHEKVVYLQIPFKLSTILKVIFFEKLAYVRSPLAIIDLLAMLPNYRGWVFLQIFLIFRLIKLLRYSSSIKLFAEVLASKHFELITLAIFMGFLVFISSIAIYLFENSHEGGQVKTIYDAFYWSIVTVSTVGYGDITPKSLGGRLVAISLILSGLGVLSFFTSIIVSAFNDKMHDLRENRTYSLLDKHKDFIIICGYGRVGQEVAQQLHKDKQFFVIIDKNQDRLFLAKKANFLAIHNDATKNEVLLNAGINRGAAAVLCTVGNDVTNVYITLSSRYLNSTIRIIARANRHDNVKKLHQAGANHVIEPFEMAGLLAAEYIGQPVAIEALLGILHEQKQITMDTLLVREGSMLEGITLKEIDFSARKLSLIGVISASSSLHRPHRNQYQVEKQHFFFNPERHFQCRKNDILVVLGRDISIAYFREQIIQSCLKM